MTLPRRCSACPNPLRTPFGRGQPLCESCIAAGKTPARVPETGFSEAMERLRLVVAQPCALDQPVARRAWPDVSAAPWSDPDDIFYGLASDRRGVGLSRFSSDLLLGVRRLVTRA